MIFASPVRSQSADRDRRLSANADVEDAFSVPAIDSGVAFRAAALRRPREAQCDDAATNFSKHS